MSVQVDLSQLAGARGGPKPRTVLRLGWVPLLTRYVLPAVLIAGFLGTLAYTFRESLWAAKGVTVIPVMAVRAEIETGDTPLFQSSGWVEPRPTPVIVAALDEGIVEKLLVIEGQELAEGDVVAQLIDADARLRLLQAEAELESRLAELASSKATLAAAETRLREPVELESMLAEAEAMLAKTETELARLPGQIHSAESRLELAEKEKESRTLSGDSIGKLMLARAINEAQTAAAALEELAAQRDSLKTEVSAQQRRVAALRRQLELKTEEHRQHDEAEAAVALAESRVASARVAVDTARLSLSRMTVRAPTAGKVLALVARPGSKVMGLAPSTAYDASTVVTMYDPNQLQIRADVRLEDVPHVVTGQRVLIETPAVRGVLEGRVIAATSLTDIQKNTLQVKVAVDEPPAVLKPDMLVQVTFLSPPSPKRTANDASRPVTLVIPPNLVRSEGDATRVWIADRHRGVAELRTITLGGTTAEGLREVKAGLSAGDRLIVSDVDGLNDGDRIEIEREAAEQSGESHPTTGQHPHPSNEQ
jgi:RND family efflux transporter MFP subunit